jgi:hypothetical protein
MSRQIDFDQICAETTPGEPLEVNAGGETFHLVAEPPWLSAVAWDEGRVDDAILMLVPAKEVDKFRSVLFSGNASRDIAWKRLMAIWKLESGESPASSRPSGTGSARSRPTSKRTTG